jgi:hypothetical protein
MGIAVYCIVFQYSLYDFSLQRNMLIRSYFSLNGNFHFQYNEQPTFISFFCESVELHTQHVGRWELNKCQRHVLLIGRLNWCWLRQHNYSWLKFSWDPWPRFLFSPRHVGFSKWGLLLFDDGGVGLSMQALRLLHRSLSNSKSALSLRSGQ